MKYLILFAFTFLSLNFAYGQYQSISDFDTKHDGLTIYLYQSMIRMLNVEKNEDFNKLIRHLDYVECNVHLTPNDTVIRDFNKLSNQLSSEGLVDFFSIERPGEFFRIFQPENESKLGNWVFLFHANNRLGYLKVEGNLDPNYLSSIHFMNFDEFIEDFNFEDFQNWH